jgi:nitrate reductase NapA
VLDKRTRPWASARARHPVEQKNRTSAGKHWLISFDDFKEGGRAVHARLRRRARQGRSDEPLDKFKAKLVELVDIYVDPKRNVMSFWTMGFNQHIRGVWVNEQCYATHLLLGKHARPGNGAFSLTGQPSACGTAREVGTFSHRLPADMLVDNAAHRKTTEEMWKLPPNTLNPKIGSDIMAILRDLEDGGVKFLWIQTTNPFQSTPNANHWLKAAREMDSFIVVAEAYPTVTAKVADLILPAAMIFEKWGGYGNAERRTQLWRQQVDPPGEARSDVWMMLEFAKRFRLKDVWGEKAVAGVKADGYPDGKLPDVLAEAQKLGYTPETTLYEALFATADNRKVAWPDPVAKGHGNSTVKALKEGWFVEKAVRGVPPVHRG